ncbi:MAG: hypothetical protein AAF800_03750 [Planctomycetota bacterium]
MAYTDRIQRFPRSNRYDLFTSWSCLGEVKYRGRWHTVGHQPLIDLPTFQRVQTLPGAASKAPTN